MAASSASLSGIEVNGKTGIAILQGFGKFTLLGSEYLLEEGIGVRDQDGLAQIERLAWYPLESWLRVLERVRANLGDRVLSQIGWALPRGGPPPPTHKDVHDALVGLDGAYHRNHRRSGELFFDAATNTVRDGIGNYRCQHEPGERVAVFTCDTPYPCAFDLAVVHSLAQRWQESAQARHEPGACRLHGAPSCTYRISWK